MVDVSIKRRLKMPYQRRGKASPGMKLIDVYYDDENFLIMSREQWIDCFIYDMTYGFMKDFYASLDKAQKKALAIDNFEEQRKMGIIKFYGVKEIVDEDLCDYY